MLREKLVRFVTRGRENNVQRLVVQPSIRTGGRRRKKTKKTNKEKARRALICRYSAAGKTESRAGMLKTNTGSNSRGLPFTQVPLVWLMGMVSAVD